MEFQARLQELKESQRQLLSQYESLVQDYDANGLAEQNETLRRELTACKERLAQLGVKYQHVTAENQNLRISLQEQILDEKLTILKNSRDKLDTYFKSAEKKCTNRLTALELEIEREIAELRSAAVENLGQEQEHFVHALNQWAQNLGENIRRHREKLAADFGANTHNRQMRFAKLEAEGISEEVIQKRIKQNETEMKIGLNWINKIGIILILFGVGAAAKYVHSTWFTDYMRGASFFLLGGLFLGGGEWMYRKGRDVFSTGLLGGGISILYCAVFYSYFLLHIIGLHTGLFVSVLITLTTVALSVRYRSKTICSLGLIGGYLPFFSYILSFDIKDEGYYIAMGYLFLLNLSVLGVAFWQKWNVVNYLSMFFHIPSLLYLVYQADHVFASMLYTILTFTTHLFTQLAYSLKFAVNLKKVDVLLLGANTFLSCSILYGLFDKGNLSGYNGLLALAFCLIYIGVARLIERKIPGEKYGSVLFYATSLTFAILMIPFQFGLQWMSMGWLAEGVILIICSLKYRQEKLEKAGWLIFALCLGAFYLGDVAHTLPFIRSTYFIYKFTWITAGTICVTAAYLLDSKQGGMSRYGTFWKIVMGFKYLAIINAWIYFLYIGQHLYSLWMPRGDHFTFYKTVLLAMLNVGAGYIVCRIPLLYDKAVQVISLLFYSFGILLCILLNVFMPVVRKTSDITAEYGAVAMLLCFNLLMLLVVKKLLLSIIARKHLNLEFYPLGIILYLLGNVTLILTQQFHLGGNHLVSSLVWILAALTALIYGFRKNYIYTRRFGLGLSIVATAKLFIIDLAFLDTLKKIVAYFIFGFVLLGISYLYQRLKMRAEGKDHDAKM